MSHVNPDTALTQESLDPYLLTFISAMDSPRRCESPEPTEEAEAGPSSPQTTLATLPLTRRASSTLQRVAETTGLVGKVVGVKVARVALSVTFPTTTAFIKVSA